MNRAAGPITALCWIAPVNAGTSPPTSARMPMPPRPAVFGEMRACPRGVINGGGRRGGGRGAVGKKGEC